MRINATHLRIFGLALILAVQAMAQSVSVVYQGVVRVEEQLFTGAGQFKFALVTLRSPLIRQAKATAVVNSGFVTSYTLTDNGAGYTTTPAVTITDSTGMGAQATATVSAGRVTALAVVATGSGYSASPTVRIEGPIMMTNVLTAWSNDGTSTNGSQPTAAVTIAVERGAFTARLGDTRLTNMTAVPLSAYQQSDLHLRIWFNDGTHGFVRLEPDQALTPTPSALRLIEPVVIPVTNMTRIPPGSFPMGSTTNDVDRRTDEGPLTTVTISEAFWIGIYPVTQREYFELIGSNPSLFTGDFNRPVEMVNWMDATNYCAKLTARERTAGKIPANYEYRLATEAEREYAGRAGTMTRFDYGDDPTYSALPDFAWFFVNSGNTTHPVGQKRPNPWGLHEIHGNVWEWCQDFYTTNYLGGAVADPKGPEAGTLRVMRGGSWGSDGKDCRSAARIGRDPTDPRSVFGFRVVLARIP